MFALYQAVAGFLSSSPSASPAGTSSTSLPSLEELDYHQGLYRLVLHCLEDAAKKPGISEAEKAQLEEQCAQTRDRIAALHRLFMATMMEETYKHTHANLNPLGPPKDKNV
ncbi:hypothetical protein HMN09_01280300 [Mycena chlorophos]|uniref:Uncharacterized protein n=1 Tax=Mycena chlorophos TaxID=658473 RepID=A0A8H6S369_MYCCL|nr:hypothetical protein HMN09_01280300 [Mycena chlorophos]